MLTLENQNLDISEIQTLALKLSKELKVGDVVLLKGDLGVGKTTFCRFLINNLCFLNNLSNPNSINSPTFPILLTYDLIAYEIYHYDLYRIKSIKELEQLDFFENINNSITFIEWPELLINYPLNHKYYLINMDLYSDTKRTINITYNEI